MESLISIDTIGCLVALLAFALLLACSGTRGAPRRLHPRQCRTPARGSEATVSGRTREGSPPAHGKERTPC
jgi:hypothetical protein